MTYLYWYFGIGLPIVLAILYGEQRLSKSKSSFFIDLDDSGIPNSEKLAYRILYKIVLPLLLFIIVVAVWPLLMYSAITHFLQKKKDPELPEQDEFPKIPDFAVECTHMVERLTVQEIEMREFVKDPLKAAPELPFGHLNAAWKKFLNAHSHNAELWSFSAQWPTTWGSRELLRGYVVVRAGAPGPYFLTIRKDNVDEA